MPVESAGAEQGQEILLCGMYQEGISGSISLKNHRKFIS
jgi:hypothetical protein